MEKGWWVAIVLLVAFSLLIASYNYFTLGVVFSPLSSESNNSVPWAVFWVLLISIIIGIVLEKIIVKK